MQKSIAIILLFICTCSYAQFYDAGKNWNIGINMGIDRFFGDVSPQSNPIFANPLTVDFYKDRNFAVSAYFGKEIASFWFVRVNALYCNLGIKNYTMKLRSKISHIHEISMLHSFDIFGCFPRCKELKNWDLILSIGVGWLGYRSILYELESDKTINYVPNSYYKENGAFKYVVSMPFGIGFGYQFARNWKFNFATNYRWINDDLFDACSSDKKNMEGFAFLQIGFQYFFHFKTTARNTEDDYALERKSPNYQYKKNQLKYGFSPVNNKRKTGADYKTYHKKNKRS